MLKNYFSNREYDLPWDRPFKESMWIAFIGLCIPYSIKFPISEIFCIIVIVYYSLLKPHRNRLGFSLTPGAKRTLLYISLILVSLNVFAFVIIQDVKFEAHMENDPETVMRFSLERSIFREWEPDYRFGQAVLSGALFQTLNLYKRLFYLEGVLAPIYESVFFFGILFPALWRRFSYRKSMLLTTIVFLFMHFPTLDSYSIFNYSLFVLISIHLYVRIESLFPLILFHAMGNITLSAFVVYLNWELQTVYTNLLD